MDGPIRILILEDNAADAELVMRELRKAGLAFTPWLAQDRRSFLEALESANPDLVLADYSLPGFDGLSALALARERFGPLPVIIVSGAIGEETAIEALKAGATDYVLKQRLSRLGPVVSRAIEEARQLAERRHAEEALRESREQFRLLVEGVVDYALFMLDPDGRVVSWNPGAERIEGWRAEEVIGRHFAMLYLPEDAAAGKPQRELDTAALDGSYKEESLRQRKDGATFWADVTVTALRDGDGRLRGFAMLIRDVTERKRSEQALRQANDDLERRVAERTAELHARANQLRALASQLTLSEQRERVRIAELLHDHLQQLLVAAQYRTAILRRTGDGAAKDAAGDVVRLLEEAISTSRSLTAELSPLVLHEGGLTAALEWLARWMAEKYGLRVELSLGEGLPAAAEDVKILLFESVRELLFNAVKHAHAASASVSVRRADGGGLVIAVSDAGPGFDPAKLKPAGRSGGGFGLFSIRERLELVGGGMGVDSSPEGGSRFTLTVPGSATEPAGPAVPERHGTAHGNENNSSH